MSSDVVVRCQHCRPREATKGGDYVEKLLPSGYSHLLCLSEPSDEEEDFRAHLKLRLSTEEEVEEWLQALQRSSTLTWRKARTYPQSGRYNAYRVDLRCQHKTYSTGKRSRNTNCPATLFLVLKRHMEDRKSRSGDPHMAEGYFLHVKWRNEHNHRVAFADAERRREVSAAIKLTEPYERGDSPSASPFDIIKYELQDKEGDDCLYADRSTWPDLQLSYSSDDGESAGPSPSIPSGTPEENTPEFLERQLDDIVGLLKTKLRKDATFTAAAKSFVCNFHKLRTDGALQSALICFGKTAHVTSKVRATPRGFLQTSTGAQPTAATRRKAGLGGRPPNRREHPYTKPGRANGAQHSLSLKTH